METLSKISAEIVKLRWEKKFREALDIYRSKIHRRFGSDVIAQDHKLTGSIIDSLKELGKIAEAVSMIENFWRFEPAGLKNKNLILNLSWTYFFAFDPDKKNSLPETPQRMPMIRFLLALLQEENVRLYGSLFFRYLEHLSQQQPQPWNQVLLLLEEFPENTFGDEAVIITVEVKGKTRETELAPDREKWLVWKSKALYMTAHYEECIETGRKAFEEIQKFHHGNQHWIARRMALCYKQLGDLGKAIHELEKLLHKRREWFIEKELAEMYMLRGDYNNALIVSQSACINQGFSVFKAGLFKLVADIMVAVSMPEEACKFYNLAGLVRKEQQWKIPAELEQALSACTRTQHTNAEIFYHELISPRMAHAKTVIGHKVPVSTGDVIHGNGFITRILHPGSNGDGFITDEQGNGIYFRFSNCQIPNEEIGEGMKVGFAAKKTERNGKNVYQALKVYMAK